MKKAAILGCFLFFFFSNAFTQTRFNIREDLGFEAVIFKGIYEVDNSYLVTGNCVELEDSVIFFRMLSVVYSLEGNVQNSQTFSNSPSFFQQNSLVGMEIVNSTNGISTAGQTFDYANDASQGYLMNLNEEGDTNSVFLFQSPYLEEYGEDFISPLAISPSTNPDGSFFVSSNIFKSDQNTATDAWIQRMSPSGETMWSYIYATEANPDKCSAMLPKENGGVLIAIWQFGPDEIISKFIELDAQGNQISEWILETTSRINDIIRASDQTIIMASATPDGTPGLIGAVYKVSPEGFIEWQVLLGDDAPVGFEQEFTNIVHAQDGNYVAGGVNYEYVTNPTDTSGATNRNGWLVKINDEGDVLWDRKYHFINSPSDDHTLNDLKATSDGGYIFCGESRDEDPNQEFTEGPRQQGWLVKVDEYGCLVEGCEQWDGINVIEQDSDIQFFKAGPIPAGQFLNIYQTFNSLVGSLYQLIDMNGKVVEEFPAPTRGTTSMLDVSQYPAGSYQLVLRKGNEVFQSEKILVN